MYGSEIYHSREHVIYERRVKTRSGGLSLRDGERIAWSSTLRDDLLQTRGYDIKFVRPLIYDEVLRTYIVYSNHQFRVIRLRPTPTYLIHVIMVTHCLSIITRLQHRVIYIYVPRNISGVSQIYACYM